MTQKRRILNLLKDRHYHSPTQIVEKLHIFQYGARIKELRDNGIIIENTKFKHIDKFSQFAISIKKRYIPKPEHTFFRLVTPNEEINFETLKLEGQDAIPRNRNQTTQVCRQQRTDYITRRRLPLLSYIYIGIVGKKSQD